MEKTTLEEARRKRKVVRANSTRYVSKVQNICDLRDDIQIDEAIEKVKQITKELKEINYAVQELLGEDELEGDMTQCEKYDEELDKCTIQLKRVLREMRHESTQTMNREVCAQPISKPKLPELKLPEFNGNIQDWQAFWEQFKASVDNNNQVNVIDKHIYLRNLLKGDALAIVSGIEISEANYKTVKEKLEKRFGNKDLIIQQHIDFIDRMKASKIPTPKELRNSFNELQGRIDALKALGENIEGYGRLLTNKILRLFPKSMRLLWYRFSEVKQEGSIPISELLEFLNKEIERNETVEKLEAEGDHTSSDEEEIKGRLLTTESLHVHSKGRQEKKHPTQPYCVFCDRKGHWGQNCEAVKDVKERKEKLKQTDRCFLCMGKQHKTKNCRRRQTLKCQTCKSDRHHTAICERKDNTLVNAVSTTVKTMNEKTYLQTARVWVEGRNGKTKLTRCVLDTGSHTSFIDVKLINELQLESVGEECINLKAFETSSRMEHMRKRVSVKLGSTVNKNSVIVEALESSNTYSSLPSVSVTLRNKYKKLKFADPEEEPKDLPIQILIGSDFYWSIVQEDIIRISNNFVLAKTKFGWIVNGGNCASKTHNVHSFLIMRQEEDCLDDVIIRRFWELETLGIKEQDNSCLSRSDEKALNHFQETFKIENGRAVVSLPWKEEADELKDNYEVASKRYERLKGRFNRDKTFKEKYTTAMMNYYSDDHIERVKKEDQSGTRTYYLPHQAVIHENRQTTKVRIVFDASSHEKNSPSLNEMLYTGPNLNPDTTAALMRFRVYNKALAGDGSKAFLQLSLNERDRDSTRFIWYEMLKDEDGSVRVTNNDAVYRFTRLPFGLNCSPFLLAAAIRTYARHRETQYPTVARILGKSLYVDDFTSGADDDDETLKIYTEVTALTSEIQLPMAKWVSNSQKLRNEWQKTGFGTKITAKILGINWDTEQDEFWFEVESILRSLHNVPCTKRILLTTTAKLYDPIGLITPITINGKILFQDTWNRGLQWDHILPPDLAKRWQDWVKTDLAKLDSIRIPRWIGTWKGKPQNREIHVFCDASERAYGAVVYVRTITEQETIRSRLLISKSRLAPVKKVTLPRLELFAALVGTRLLKYTLTEIDLFTEHIWMWSDSTVTLSWIKNETSQWKPFVANRVTEIKESTSPEQWRYCPGKQNPADFLTRGLSVENLRKTECWWSGPDWLVKDESFWPKTSFTGEIVEEAKKEQKRNQTSILTVQTKQNPVDSCIDVERINNYPKLLRIMGWILRFIKGCKKNSSKESELNAEELNESKGKWISLHQKQYYSKEIEALQQFKELPKTSPIKQYNPFLDEKGILRLGGRLQFAETSTEEKHPILLEGKDKVVKLLIRNEHERLFHMGTRVVLAELRSQYWISHGRQAVRQTINSCIICRKSKCQSGAQYEAPLPVGRLKITSPFETTGIDFAGPLYVRRNTTMEKTYIALFTCAVTRAIHLELISNMSTERFILALQRFFGRRGVSRIIYTDNAKTFKAAEREIKFLWESVDGKKTAQFFAHHGVTWKFIVERAAWWGGWWERMVQTTKRCLRKSIGKARLDEEELRTVLIGIEAAINSRPITYLYNMPDEEEPLTPAHFLTGDRLTKLPTSGKGEAEKEITKIWRKRQQTMNSFWRRWTKEYLLDLKTFHCVRGGEGPSFHENDVVLLFEDNLPRHLWRMGRIIEVINGRDRKPRSCTLQMPNGTKLKRPIQLLYPLELQFGQGGECHD